MLQNSNIIYYSFKILEDNRTKRDSPAVGNMEKSKNLDISILLVFCPLVQSRI